MDIVLAHGHTSIEIMHSIVPFLELERKKPNNFKFSIIDYNFFDISRVDGDVLILIRRFHDGSLCSSDKVNLLQKLRGNFNKVVYFDDSASASVIHYDILANVDGYWKKSLFENFDNYKKSFYGGCLYADFYHKTFGIKDNPVFINESATNTADLKKIKLAWSIGIGCFPTAGSASFNYFYPTLKRAFTAASVFQSTKIMSLIHRFYLVAMRRQLSRIIHGESDSRKLRKVSARFPVNLYRSSIGFQRLLYHTAIDEDQNFLSGTVNYSEYQSELRATVATLSPFGWGEVCYRDFEAILSGSVLIKPCMAHLVCWPDVYTSDASISVAWDGLGDLTDLLDEAIESRERRTRNAAVRLLECLDQCSDRAEGLLLDLERCESVA